MEQKLTGTLVMRNVQSTEDVERLAAFNNAMHTEPHDPPDGIKIWTTDLLDGNHLTATWDDFLLVEDTASGEIVSTLGIIPQQWRYGDIEFGVGRVELVATHSDYRQKGLVRAQFEAIHRRCQQLNLPVQSITGIPYYYRLFGYEYAVELGGGQTIELSDLDQTPDDSGYTLRKAIPADIPHLDRLYAAFTRDRLISVSRSPDMWQYLFFEMTPGHIYDRDIYVIECEQIVGYVIIVPFPIHNSLRVTEVVLGRDYAGIMPWLVKSLRDDIQARFNDQDSSVSRIYFGLGSTHPAYPFLKPDQPFEHAPYAWYMRVSDLAEFIRLISPVLEHRIAQGPLSKLCQTLTISFYRGGLELEFYDGMLVRAENLSGVVEPEGVGFPPGVFLQLLFGYRSFEDLSFAYPDVFCKLALRPVLAGLFPKQPSWVRGLV